MTPRQAQQKLSYRREAFVRQLLTLRQKAADLELWKTYQAMDASIKAVGYEIAEQAEKRQGK